MTRGKDVPEFEKVPLPQSVEFEVRWEWVRTDLNVILGGTRHFAAMGQHPPTTTSAEAVVATGEGTETVDPVKVLELGIEFVVRLAADGTIEAVVGSPCVPGLTPEVLVQAMRGQGMAVRVMSAFEAVTLAWEDNTARTPWVDLVESALEVMMESVRTGDAMTLRRVLLKELPESSAGRVHHPL
ncbi:hypothetical protein [Luteibacter aegosomatissinici]|uniref:hypothetical protein n=1 Tax=Luteibacter aegosomatissinici TaxID=2911539 RepID=UPI001FF9F1CA|nr:hypothetical protein [Luteibacter aegosomatissinici]UPG92793.1 hypothetical protein L2Y97_13055 [Luteibacter aegosomatissinici]